VGDRGGFPWIAQHGWQSITDFGAGLNCFIVQGGDGFPPYSRAPGASSIARLNIICY